MCYKKLYQTVGDSGNPIEVETDGPFKCTNIKREPWLGEGYYFWENYIENAHWWGEKGYGKHYMIRSAICEDNNFFDLTSGSTEHIDILRSYWDIFLKRKPNMNWTVGGVLMHMIKYSNLFTYVAIRADGINSANRNATVSRYRLYFPNNTSYINLMPQIQICIIDKVGAGLRDYQVIHPPHYCSGGYV